MAGTLPPHQRAEFKALCDELEQIEQRRLADEMRRSHVEARVLQLVGTEIPPHERRQHMRIQCELPVRVRSWNAEHPGVVVEIGAGGALIVTPLMARVAEIVELVAGPKPGVYASPLAVRGRVAWVKDTKMSGRAGIGVAFNADFLPNVRAFVLELLRSRLRE